MALYHAQPCAWDQLGSVGCHNFLKSLDEETPLVEKTKKKRACFFGLQKRQVQNMFFFQVSNSSVRKKQKKKVLLKKSVGKNRALKTPEALLYWSAWSHKNTKKPTRWVCFKDRRISPRVLINNSQDSKVSSKPRTEDLMDPTRWKLFVTTVST